MNNIMYQSDDNDNKQKFEELVGVNENKAVVSDKGMVTTITIGGSTFDILSPKTLKDLLTKLDEQSRALVTIQDRVNTLSNSVRSLNMENKNLKQQLAILTSKLKDGFGNGN